MPHIALYLIMQRRAIPRTFLSESSHREAKIHGGRGLIACYEIHKGIANSFFPAGIFESGEEVKENERAKQMANFFKETKSKEQVSPFWLWDSA